LRLEATLRDLQEDQVYGRLATELSLSAQLRQPVEAIVRYAFTEMLNNAIDHSEADRCSILFKLDAAAVSFEIRDKGIGVFHSIASKLGLEDEQAAMIELFKGKTTTQPDQHSGEGIFFTSRAADRFILRSHRIQVEWSLSRGDIFVSRQRFITGTKVSFRIQRDSRRRLEDVFQPFAPAEYDFRFQKTRVHVRLLSREYVSRSEARRLLLNLEKFSEVALDFTQVRSLGQGFADEIFRVFAAGHPDTKLVIENANPTIAAMLHHVQHKEGPGA
jgi:anti-sigma regulatory factor (Ser/Thr protein kinase)